MTKEQIHEYFNLSRVIKTIPEEAFEKDPQAQQLGMYYSLLEQEYFKYFDEANAKPVSADAEI